MVGQKTHTHLKLESIWFVRQKPNPKDIYGISFVYDSAWSFLILQAGGLAVAPTMQIHASYTWFADMLVKATNMDPQNLNKSVHISWHSSWSPNRTLYFYFAVKKYWRVWMLEVGCDKVAPPPSSLDPYCWTESKKREGAGRGGRVGVKGKRGGHYWVVLPHKAPSGHLRG